MNKATSKNYRTTNWSSYNQALIKWSGYHYRSLVETKMHCIKLLGRPHTQVAT